MKKTSRFSDESAVFRLLYQLRLLTATSQASLRVDSQQNFLLSYKQKRHALLTSSSNAATKNFFCVPGNYVIVKKHRLSDLLINYEPSLVFDSNLNIISLHSSPVSHAADSTTPIPIGSLVLES